VYGVEHKRTISKNKMLAKENKGGGGRAENTEATGEKGRSENKPAQEGRGGGRPDNGLKRRVRHWLYAKQNGKTSNCKPGIEES